MTTLTMNILYVTPFAPTLTNGGGLLAYANLASLCSYPDAAVDYVGPPFDAVDLPLLHNRPFRMIHARCFRGADRIAAMANGAATSLYGLYRDPQSPTQRRDHDWIFIESTRCGFAVSPGTAKRGIVVMAQNVEYDYMRRTQRGLNRLATVFVRRSERRSLRQANVLLVLHTADQERFHDLYGQCFCAEPVIHPACALDTTYAPVPWEDRERVIIFVGSLNQAFNELGLLTFLESEWPAAAPSGYRLVIAGRAPTRRLRQAVACGTNVTLMANPSNMLTILRQARLLVLPDPYGMGMKLRVAQAMSLGVPVVGTRLGLRGYEPIEAFGMATEGIPGMGVATRAILEDEVRVSRLARQAHQLWVEHYSYRAFEQRIHTVLSRPCGWSQAYPRVPSRCAPTP